MVSELECEMEYDSEQKFVRKITLYPNFLVHDFEAVLEKAGISKGANSCNNTLIQMEV